MFTIRIKLVNINEYFNLKTQKTWFTLFSDADRENKQRQNLFILHHNHGVDVCVCVSVLQLRSYNRHTLVADPYEDGLCDFLLKKQKITELEKKVRHCLW